MRALSAIVEAETAPRTVQVRVLAAFAALALLLAGIGIHGLLAFTVSNRAQEIGVRMALGARRSDILGLVLRHGLVLGAVGVGLGLALALAAGRGLEALLAGVSPRDAATFLAATGVAISMALLGSLLPAHTRDPGRPPERDARRIAAVTPSAARVLISPRPVTVSAAKRALP